MESEENTRLDTLIDGLRQRGVLNDRRVEAAFRAVPRHVFLPGLDLDEVYQDQAIITKRENQVPVSSSSQPAIMAIMLERLMVEPGHNLLEIGTGTGYNAALMAFLAGEHGRVTSVEIDEEIALQARQNLQNLAAVTALTGRLAPIQAHCAEGGLGSTEFAPYDRIILTVGAWDIAPAWLEQLKPGGHLVLPLWFHGTQFCLTLMRVGDHLESLAVDGCGFMRLRGAFAGPETFTPLDDEKTLFLAQEGKGRIEPGRVMALLTGAAPVDYATGVDSSARRVYQGLDLWLALRGDAYVALFAQGTGLNRQLIPYLYGSPDQFVASRGLLSESTLCLLMRPPHSPMPAEERVQSSFEIYVRRFGPDESMAHDLIRRVQDWESSGSPTWEQIPLRVYPIQAADRPRPGEIEVRKRWMKYFFEAHSAN